MYHIKPLVTIFCTPSFIFDNFYNMFRINTEVHYLYDFVFPQKILAIFYLNFMGAYNEKQDCKPGCVYTLETFCQKSFLAALSSNMANLDLTQLRLYLFSFSTACNCCFEFGKLVKLCTIWKCGDVPSVYTATCLLFHCFNFHLCLSQPQEILWFCSPLAAFNERRYGSLS